MADSAPTFYNLKSSLNGKGMNQGDLHRAIFNLEKAIYAICYKLDEDNGTLGTDYKADVGTDLETAMAKLKTPTGGPVT
jgi:hypothetical protein